MVITISGSIRAFRSPILIMLHVLTRIIQMKKRHNYSVSACVTSLHRMTAWLYHPYLHLDTVSSESSCFHLWDPPPRHRCTKCNLGCAASATMVSSPSQWNKKNEKKIEKVEKVSLFFHESWCIMMYHPFTISVSCHHDLHLHPSGLGHGMRILNGRWIPLHLSCWLQKSTWAVQSWACRVAESGVPVLIANKTFLWSQVQVGLKPLWENWWVQDSLKLRYSISSGLKDGWSLFNNSVMTLASNKLTWSGRAHLSALPVGNRLQDPIFPLAHRPPERSRRVRISNLNVNVCRV